jgi:hypothetical protein
MSDYDQSEYFQYHQQRFEAALEILKIKMVHGNGQVKIGEAVREAIALADLLIAELEETRTKTDEDTPF